MCAALAAVTTFPLQMKSECLSGDFIYLFIYFASSLKQNCPLCSYPSEELFSMLLLRCCSAIGVFRTHFSSLPT